MNIDDVSIFDLYAGFAMIGLLSRDFEKDEKNPYANLICNSFWIASQMVDEREKYVK